MSFRGYILQWPIGRYCSFPPSSSRRGWAAYRLGTPMNWKSKQSRETRSRRMHPKGWVTLGFTALAARFVHHAGFLLCKDLAHGVDPPVLAFEIRADHHCAEQSGGEHHQACEQ